MSSATLTEGLRAPGGLRWRQLQGVLRLELRKSLLGRRAFAVYLLAFLPLSIVVLRAIFGALSLLEMEPPATVAGAFFVAFFEGYLRVPVFLGALYLFMNLFRAEIMERSLHYYFLTPVRRDLLVAGKYLAALLAMCCIFLAATAAMYLLLLLPGGVGQTMDYLFRGPGLGHLATYLGITAMACVGYGAVFLLAGLFFRNPVVPAFMIWLWEGINFVLPPLLKKLSVTYYLQSLYPIPLPKGLLAVMSEPTSAWISVPGFVLFTALVLIAAGWRARNMEVRYGAD